MFDITRKARALVPSMPNYARMDHKTLKVKIRVMAGYHELFIHLIKSEIFMFVLPELENSRVEK